MKKLLLMFAVAAMSAQTVSAQALEPSSTWDNWYIGINGGVDSKTIHNSKRMALNSHAGLRIGRNWTPVAGWLVEGTVFFRDRDFGCSPTFIKSASAELLGTINFSNWFGGYKGQPRCFEVIGLYGIGFNHVFGDAVKHTDLVSKIGFDLAVNLGQKRAWQIYVEPAINYNLESPGNVEYNLNHSALQLSVGVNYKFGNSNGTHNFALAQLRDQAEIDQLNAKINELRGDNAAKDRTIANDQEEIVQLKKALSDEMNKKPQTMQKVVKQVVNNVLQPTVIFGQGKSTVDAAQMASVAMVAKYMKNHPESKILIKGYASPEGNPELNQRLSEARANSVKNALVKRYGIAASRLEVKGMGATDELFDEVDFNRVATFTDTTK